MEFTKNKGFGITISVIGLVLLNLASFLIPFVHTTTFWLAYCFATVAALLLIMVSFMTLGEKGLKAKFLNLPFASVAWVYFVLQLAFAFWQMANSIFPYKMAIILNSALLGVFLILGIASFIGKNEVSKIDEKNAEKVFYLKSLQADIELMETSDKKLAKELEDLAESIRFSDPMSHSELAAIENKIENKVEILKDELDNVDTALSLCNDIQKLLKERNAKTKLLKNTPDIKTAAADNSGTKIVGVTFGIVGVIAAVVLIICFVIIPSKQYKAACKLYDDGKYAEAVLAFETLGNYKDSLDKIDEIKEAVKEETYQNAESEYKNENYAEAISIYTALGDYKDSKERIEHIYNMWAKGKDLFFGSYKGTPIAWIVLEQKDDEMLILAKEPVIQLAMHDKIENVDWDSSSIKMWLNDDFLKDFSVEQKEKINNGNTVFLLSEKEFNKYSEDKNLKCSSDWWLRSENENDFMFVDAAGKINEDGESAVRAKGIRPAMWISLEK